MRRPGQVLALLSAAATAPVASGWVSAPLAVPRSPATVASLHQQLRVAAVEPAAVPWAEEEAQAAPASEVAPRWFRAFLASLAAAAAAVVVAVGSPGAARAEGSVNVFFGQGCFWHVQHELVKKEEIALKRGTGEITALAGYAGGTKVGADGQVCYHNMMMAPDYGQMGHTEVVNVSIPEGRIGDFAKDYFDDAAKYFGGRADPQDMGGEYRSAIGFPGGMDGPLFKQVEDANKGRLQLVRGEGNDPDTVFTKKVFVYDSDKFPFHQGEVYHQFHDDMRDRYSEEYHKLKGTLVTGGKLQKVACPEMGF